MASRFETRSTSYVSSLMHSKMHFVKRLTGRCLSERLQLGLARQFCARWRGAGHPAARRPVTPVDVFDQRLTHAREISTPRVQPLLVLGHVGQHRHQRGCLGCGNHRAPAPLLDRVGESVGYWT